MTALSRLFNGEWRQATPSVPTSLHLGMAVETIVDLSTMEKGVPYSECLARLLVNDAVVLKGGQFIPQLEAQAVIGFLDTAMVGLVLDALEQNRSLRLGCNVSPRTLADASAWDSIVLKLSERPSAAMRLTLEVTETAPLAEIPEAASRLGMVQAYGVSIALDDFGSGFAIHSHVRNLKIDWDIIKIDRVFLSDLRKSPSGRDGLASVIALARAFAPTVIVEGIETAAHLERAYASGANLGQGWLFEGQEPDAWNEFSCVVADRILPALRSDLHPDPATSANPVSVFNAKTPKAGSLFGKALFGQLLADIRLLTAESSKPDQAGEVNRK